MRQEKYEGRIEYEEPASKQEGYPSIKESLSMLQKYQQESYELLSQYNDLVTRATGVNLRNSDSAKQAKPQDSESNLCMDLYNTVQMSQHINVKLHQIIQALNEAL